jgi:DMSO/TMAO reductase YedYZ molybdopterin-dependent catalytic subunit
MMVPVETVVQQPAVPAAPARDRLPSGPVAAVCGVVAAAVALAVGEVVTGLRGAGPSLVTAVGSEFIDRFAASLKDLAVQLFGTNDKRALVIGIVVTSLLIGAALGVAARRRRWVPAAGFAAFGLLGWWAYAADPQGSGAVGFVAAALAASAGIATFEVLWRLALSAAPEPERVTDPVDAASPASVGRRRFVLAVAGCAGGAVVLAASGRRLRAADSVESTRRSTVLPRAVRTVPVPARQPFSVDGLTPYVTSNDDFYRIDTALTTPQVDTASWRLAITGMVDAPLELSYDDLLAMEAVEVPVTLQCVSNEVGGELVGTAVWQGVALADLLGRAGVPAAATQIVGRSVDGFTAGFPTDVGLDGRTAVVAYAMNGEPLPAAHGYPARLVVAGLYGYVSATKWLREIELTTWEGFDGYWIPRGWSKLGPIKVASRIDVPRERRLAAGRQAVAGVAWAPTAGIRSVEVQVDGGAWQRCELGAAASGDTWVQWYLDWDATPGEHVLRVRATSVDGSVQIEEPSRPAPDGATGYHQRKVEVA